MLCIITQFGHYVKLTLGSMVHDGSIIKGSMIPESYVSGVQFSQGKS